MSQLPPYYPQQPWPPFSEALLDWDESFHELMLNDHIRMVAYKKAIFEAVKPGMRVLDLGTGTGILSLWALQAGAAEVYGVDLSTEILQEAVKRMAEAGFADRFNPLNQLSYDVQLEQPVDVLISEIIGNMADNEDFQPILQDAIARLVKPGGTILPLATSSYLVPVAASEAHQALSRGEVASFGPRYDLHTLLAQKGIHSAFNLYYDCILPQELYLAEPQLLCSYSGQWDQPAFYSHQRRYTVSRPGQFSGFKAYFIAQLTASTALDISSGEIQKRRSSDSWKHAYLPIAHPIALQAQDQILVTFSRQPPRESGAFRQIYRWRGEVLRHGQRIALFDQCMDESLLDTQQLSSPA